MDSPYPQAQGHCGSLWPRTQSTLQRHVPAPWSVRESSFSLLSVDWPCCQSHPCARCSTSRLYDSNRLVRCPFDKKVLKGILSNLPLNFFLPCVLRARTAARPLRVFAVSQLGHLPVSPCCALVDWPVGTPFTIYAYNDLQAVRAAHPPVTVGLQAMRERSRHLECRSFVLANLQGAVASCVGSTPSFCFECKHTPENAVRTPFTDAWHWKQEGLVLQLHTAFAVLHSRECVGGTFSWVLCSAGSGQLYIAVPGGGSSRPT